MDDLCLSFKCWTNIDCCNHRDQKCNSSFNGCVCVCQQKWCEFKYIILLLPPVLNKDRWWFIVMSVLMWPPLFPMLFRQENVKFLRYLGRTKNLEFSRVIHAPFIVSDQWSQDNTPDLNLIDVYSKCEALGSAHHNGFAFEVVRLFKSMVSDHDESCLPPNEYISGLVLSSCLNIGYLSLGRQCHGYLLKSGLVFNQYVKAALVSLYSMLPDVVGAMEVLLCNPVGLQLDNNLILDGLVEKGYLGEALIILRRRILAENMAWDNATYIGIFGLCARLKDLNLGRQVHNKLLKSCDVESDESVCNVVINMYGKCKEIVSARKVFDRFESRNVVIWTTMLASYLEHGSFEESLKLFSEMRHKDVVPNESTFFVLLTVSSKLFSRRCGKLLHALSVKTGFNGHKNVENTLIDMYSRTGDIKAAEKVFLDMTNYRDIVTWNMMICGYSLHGFGNESLALFKKMLKSGEDPNYETFVGVLNASGHVEEGLYYLYELMKQKGVKPGLEHYMCIINMLIKGGRLKEALSFIVSTPSKWDAFAWSTFLTGCHAHGNYTLGIRAAELIPDDMATKVSKCCGVAQVREVMEIRGERGCSWMEIKDKTYVFASVHKGDGDQKFVEGHKMMKVLLSCLQFFLKEPDAYVEDKLKGDYDSYHSEALAIAYAIFETHDMAPICIIKASGRICSGCHHLMKLTSKVSKRLITVRDAYHFHNFQDGHCSCADYW
ncbi:unnamed protein product [Lactuca saligna]|uniref:DYW domain-containing protein n=1 Tax=Lactuca saligna TaxID=75948 RepID=A0AA35YI82_LACSI|nr:unnamed protein product [Lactuca saligna]